MTAVPGGPCCIAVEARSNGLPRGGRLSLYDRKRLTYRLDETVVTVTTQTARPKQHMSVNAQYNIAKPASLVNKITRYQRQKMFNLFINLMRIGAQDTILDVGVTSDRDYDHSNYLEAWYPHKTLITAVGVDDAGFLGSAYPGISFVRADGRELPFADATFEFVHSSAVLEHVGRREQQVQFISEAWRVARKGVFLTTPNRRFPVEFHTSLPVVHWLPKPLNQKILVVLGHHFFADENNLNLMSSRSLARAARAAGLERFDIGSVALLGLRTNLLLCGWKRSAASLRDDPECISKRDTVSGLRGT